MDKRKEDEMEYYREEYKHIKSIAVKTIKDKEDKFIAVEGKMVAMFQGITRRERYKWWQGDVENVRKK